MAGADELFDLAADLGKASFAATRKASLVVAKSAHDVERIAKTRAPVDTGALRNSISATVHTLSAEVGPTVNYAPYLEFGTSRMAPQPFMGPAADATEPGFVAAMEQLADGILE